MFWFVSLYLEEEIHAIGYGFTMLFHKFVFARTCGEAEQAAKNWATAQGMKVRKTVAKLSVQQEVSTYTFPHQIINLPKHLLDAEYDRRNYPTEYRTAGQVAEVTT